MSLGKQVALLVIILCASTAVGAILLSFGLALYFSLSDPEMRIVVADQLQFAGIVSVFALPSALGLGIPGFFLLRRVGLLKWWAVCILGLLAGSLMGKTTLTYGVPWLGCVSLGLTAAGLAWLLIVRSNLPLNPDAPKNGAPVS